MRQLRCLVFILILVVFVPAGNIAQEVMNDEDCQLQLSLAQMRFLDGDLDAVLEHLRRCDDLDGLGLKQKRTALKLLSETHLFLKNYSEAENYSRDLMNIDPMLRTADDFDTPELFFLISNYRFNVLSFEIHGILGTDFLQVKEYRNPPGTENPREQEYKRANHSVYGIGITYDTYKFPVDISLHINSGRNTFFYSQTFDSPEEQQQWNIEEVQHWLSPTLFIGYPLAPNAFPLRSFTAYFRAGVSLNYLLAAEWKDSEFSVAQFNSTRFENKYVTDKKGTDITHAYDSRILPGFHLSGGLEYRLDTHTFIFEAIYGMRKLRTDGFRFTRDLNSGISAVMIGDDVTRHSLSFQLGYRYNIFRSEQKKE